MGHAGSRTSFTTAADRAARYHWVSAGLTSSGYRVVEVWESREAADAFYGSELYKQAAAAPTQPEILMTWAISGVDRGSGWQPAD